MYVHIGDTVSVPIESIITMVHAKGGKSHKSPIHHYETLEYIAMVPEEQIKTYVVTDDCVYGSGISIKTLMRRIDEFYSIIKRYSLILYMCCHTNSSMYSVIDC